MKTIYLRVKGSSDEPYSMFIDATKITCNCTAASMGQWCKHRQAIFDNDYSAVINVSEINKLEIADIIATHQSVSLIQQIAELEKQITVLKKQQSDIKKQLGRINNNNN